MNYVEYAIIKHLLPIENIIQNYLHFMTLGIISKTVKKNHFYTSCQQIITVNKCAYKSIQGT